MIDTAKAPYAAFLLRVSIGILFILHGVYLKAFIFTMDGTVKVFAALGLPGWWAWVVMLYETIFGVMLILGMYVRGIAAVLGIHLLFVAVLGHGSVGWMFASKGGGYEFPVFWAIACFALALIGEGAWSVRVGSVGKSEAD